MTKFKVGDEVIVKMRGSKLNGKSGMVTAIWIGEPNIYRVDFEDGTQPIVVFEPSLKHRGQ